MYKDNEDGITLSLISAVDVMDMQNGWNFPKDH